MKPVDLRENDLVVLRTAFCQFPAVCEVKVFGSRARQTAWRASDRDLVPSGKLANPRLKQKIDRDGVIIYLKQTAP